MSQREEKLWKDFLQGIRDDNEDQVKRILLETRNLNLGGGKSNFLTRKITTTQGTLTVLHSAVKNGAESIIKLLFKNGVNVNATSEPHKFTALHMAVEQDKNGIIQLLLSQNDVNVNACDEYGHTPLKLAAEKGNQQTVKWLIEKGADITKADSVDNTAIHVAADKGHYGVLQLLLLSEAFAKNPGIIGKQNKDKNTPLHLAVARECQNSVALLLCYGAVSSLELENRHNKTPKQLAKGNKVIMELLENPLKAKQHLMELTRPVVKVIGRGGSVGAESDHYPVTEQITSQPTSTSLATVLSQATPGFQPASEL
ncbi:serine/threonine-protein phosphatase 6 regulatory ankyrin repeat subunit C-like [Porites lutea]|uniref:serine/threonine-protein phosphatase 6 regulatory ankyrin repeat subunit C-like n=1 Tax=Porites lutea TaxID=51062 RepID=UPI003CC53FBC